MMENMMEGIDEWLDNDGFDPKMKNDKEFLFQELKNIKWWFRNFLISPVKSFETVYSSHKKVIQGMIRIEKLRLMILNENQYSSVKNEKTGVRYITARTYWIDDKGRKFRKFSKGLGIEKDITKNGKISEVVKVWAKNKLFDEMWEQYKEDYSIEKIKQMAS